MPTPRACLARLLRSSGYEVKTAGTVADALQLSASESFDILVSDLGLPDGSGLELMRKSAPAAR